MFVVDSICPCISLYIRLLTNLLLVKFVFYKQRINMSIHCFMHNVSNQQLHLRLLADDHTMIHPLQVILLCETMKCLIGYTLVLTWP
jgi:hypothetical protein